MRISDWSSDVCSSDLADPGQRDLGPLHYLGGWQLSSAHHGFGGISSLLAEPDGQILALSDSGTLMGFHVGSGRGERRPFIAPLPIRPQDRDRPWWAWASAAMAREPATGRHWGGVELDRMSTREVKAILR